MTSLISTTDLYEAAFYLIGPYGSIRVTRGKVDFFKRHFQSL